MADQQSLETSEINDIKVSQIKKHQEKVEKYNEGFKKDIPDIGIRNKISRRMVARDVMREREKNLSETDELTKLKNERGFNRRFKEIIEESKRSETPLVAIYIDLNDLKILNDTKGHDAGNNALIELAQILQKNARQTDLLARPHGDEFQVILYNSDINGASQFGTRVIDECKASEINISIGASQINTSNDATLNNSILDAELAMYVSKEQYKQNRKNGSILTTELTDEQRNNASQIRQNAETRPTEIITDKASVA